MSRALSESLGWLKRQALSYLAILAILLAGSWLLNEFHRARALSTQHQDAGVEADRQRTTVAQAQTRFTLADQALLAHTAALRSARDLAQQQLLAKQREQDDQRARHWPWVGLHGPEALAQSRLLDEQASALRGAVRIAQERLDAAEATRQSAAALGQLQEQARAKRAEADRLRQQWRGLSAANPVAQRFPWVAVGGELDRLKDEVERLQREAVQAESIIAAAARSREVSDWLHGRAALAVAQSALREAEVRRAQLAQAIERSPYRRLLLKWHAIAEDKKRIFLLALVLLAGAIVARLAVKLFLYYVVAPLASRRPALRLAGAYESRAFAQAAAAGRNGRISDESITLHLAPQDELLVRPECLQSSAERASKRTAWLLNPALPFTSVLSGMYLLTRVQSEEEDAIVLSSGQDPLAEVCVVDLPPGAALVCQPRSLAGVVQPRAARTRITRHWRLGSLHAWLTLQLRFLVFHGPCQLVLTGRRGVRMEPAGGGRLINQAATLAFDASVPYSNVRTETFFPYWLGKEGLFNDRFGGIDGSYLYEERPLDRRGNALFGRGLEGLSEGVLKVFGI
jgi:hypothetical protein